MSSIQLELDDQGQGADFVLVNEDLQIDPGLRTLVLVSLFSDARRSRLDPNPTDRDDDPRGSWFDDLTDRFGSKLWLLEREKLTVETRELARTYVAQALQWLLDEQIAEAVEVLPSVPSFGVLGLEITLVRGEATRWPQLWENELDQTVEFPGNRVRILTR